MLWLWLGEEQESFPLSLLQGLKSEQGAEPPGPLTLTTKQKLECALCGDAIYAESKGKLLWMTSHRRIFVLGSSTVGKHAD